MKKNNMFQNMKISDIKFYDINGYDNMYITIDVSKEIVFEKEKWLSGNERLWVKIFKDGTACYGLEMQKDPMHGNQKYTWSSRAEVINDYLELDDKYRLARYDISIKDSKDQGCYFSRSIVLHTALELAKKYEDKLHYGYEQFKKKN